MNTIQEAIEDIKQGKVVIVVDDEDRENEGDFVAAAELITPEIINFMTLYGRGLICTPIPEKRCDELQLDLMVGKNTDPKETAFTISIDLIGEGVSTGISATDRAKTIKALMDKNSRPTDFARPGHIFPLRAKEGGVLRRAGHTEAAIDLAKLAGLMPGGVIVEIMNEDGTMARVPDLLKIAEKFNVKIITIKDLIAYRLQYDSIVEQIDEIPVNTKYGTFNLNAYKQTTNNQIHFSLSMGEWNTDEEILVRMQSSNNYHDLLSSIILGDTPLIQDIVQLIAKEGKGAIIFINNITEPEQILQRFNHFKKYLNGEETKPSPKLDEKDLGIGVQILKALRINKIKLITKSNNKPIPLKMFNLNITAHVEI